MEIYKLTESVLNEATKKSGDKLTITDLKQGVKNPNRVNVFVNGKFSFSLDIAQVVEMGVKVGRKISLSELTEFQKASEFGKLYQRALEWVLLRPRSERELVDYLNKKIFEKKLNKDYVDTVVERLKEKKYIDDKKFAEYYVENRFVEKGISRKRLKMELKKKGVCDSVISEVLGARNDEDEIRKIIIKKQGKYDDEKMMAYLCRQGFSYDLVKNVMEEYYND
ncbi:RecX family transcriptional regulator [Candidatus Saccharibacteria bacterium]|nr:RecX family transcriptional regulator [Candidatus Saccharibacteria bacterium]